MEIEVKWGGVVGVVVVEWGGGGECVYKEVEVEVGEDMSLSMEIEDMDEGGGVVGGGGCKVVVIIIEVVVL